MAAVCEPKAILALSGHCNHLPPSVVSNGSVAAACRISRTRSLPLHLLRRQGSISCSLPEKREAFDPCIRRAGGHGCGGEAPHRLGSQEGLPVHALREGTVAAGRGALSPGQVLQRTPGSSERSLGTLSDMFFPASELHQKQQQQQEEELEEEEGEGELLGSMLWAPGFANGLHVGNGSVHDRGNWSDGDFALHQGLDNGTTTSASDSMGALPVIEGVPPQAPRGLPDGVLWPPQEYGPRIVAAAMPAPLAGAARKAEPFAELEGTGVLPELQSPSGSAARGAPAGSFPLVDGLYAAVAASSNLGQEKVTDGAVLGGGEGAARAGGDVAGGAAADEDEDDDVCVPSFEDGVIVRCRIRLETGASMLPHPAKVARGGEDAFFIEGDWVGVADGISGWAAVGVNSGLYSRDLMWHCAEVIRWGEPDKDPRSVVEEAHSRTDFQGSCTVTVACLDDRVLRVANLGDSGFLLLREGAVAARSQRMQHAGGASFHIGKAAGDDPSESQVYELEVLPGDVLLLGTDGLYDNVFEAQILGIVSATFAEGWGPEMAAKRLSAAAQRNAACATGTTPFCEEVKAGGARCQGGKPDDITVVVAYLF